MVETVAISTVYGVTLPKISISNEILFLMNLIVPFLIAITFPYCIKFELSPLKNALADPVSSPITARTIGVFDCVYDFYTEITFT